ncbi:MAG: hypothetical protein ICV72_10975 [Aldersonia sp.]|nr:hypothetical protein [Aldersonia sp.]
MRFTAAAPRRLLDEVRQVGVQRRCGEPQPELVGTSPVAFGIPDIHGPVFLQPKA